MLFLISILLFGLSSCAVIGGFKNGNNGASNEEQLVKTREKSVLETINTRDISSIKGLFSESALAQINNLDGKLSKFLTFYSGEYVSSKYSYSIGDIFESGNDQKSIYLCITVTTDKNTFVIACTDVISNPKNSDKVGVCHLAIIHQSDANSSVEWHSGSFDTPAVECFN